MRLPYSGGLAGYQCHSEPDVCFPTQGPIANPPPVEHPFRDDPERALVLFYFNFRSVSSTLVVHRHKLLTAALKNAASANLAQPIDYKAWGRNICGWMSDSGAWITQVHGQRFVTTMPIWNPDAEDDMDAMWSVIQILDYNPHTVRRVLRETGRDGTTVLPNGNLVEVQLATRVHMINMPDMSMETRLPCVRTTLRDQVVYEDVMLDGDRLVGIYPPVCGVHFPSTSY